MELLIERDINRLVHTEGRSFMDSDAPEFLKRPMCIDQKEVNRFEYHHDLNDLLIPDDSYAFFINCMLNSVDEKKKGQLCGLWSGYRSAIVRDTDTGKLYKLKGVALNPDIPSPQRLDNGMYRIFGGQNCMNAHYEIDMLSRFNKTLENEGIAPLMFPIGTWRYPNLCKGLRPTASVFETRGDTRLDELVCTIEGLMSKKMSIRKKKAYGSKDSTIDIGIPTKHWADFDNTAQYFFSDVGFAVGRLLRIMHRSGQSWSSTDSTEPDLPTNSHWGNIVLYRENNDVRVGLVDFDVSCSRKNLTSREMEDVQKEDVEVFNLSLEGGNISMRKMKAEPFRRKKITFGSHAIRASLRDNFARGYESSNSKYDNRVNPEHFLKLVCHLRSHHKFSFDVNDLEGYLNYYPDELIQTKTKSKSREQFFDDLIARIAKTIKRAKEEA